MNRGAAILDKLLAAAGQDVVDETGGVWLSRLHRERPRLLWSRPDSPARAPHYLAFVRGLDCAFCGAPAPSEAHHFGPRAVGQKTDDYRTVPACQKCHAAKHDKPLDPFTRLRVIQAQVDTLVRYLRIVEQK